MHFHFSTMSLLQRVRWGAALALVAVLLWAALAPVRYPTRERTFEFPRGAAVLRGEARVDGVGNGSGRGMNAIRCTRQGKGGNGPLPAWQARRHDRIPVYARHRRTTGRRTVGLQ